MDKNFGVCVCITNISIPTFNVSMLVNIHVFHYLQLIKFAISFVS